MSSTTTTTTVEPSVSLTLPASSSPTIETTVSYSLPPPDGSASWYYINAPTDGSPRNNAIAKDYRVQIHDLRSLGRNEYGLDKTGFGFEKVPTVMKDQDWLDEEKITKTYYDEVVSYLKSFLGAHTVQIFDHTVRRLPPPGVTVPDTPSTRQPVPRVHVDQTDASAENRVRRHMPEEKVEGLLKKRFQIINVWRPFHTVYDAPLALVSYHSINPTTDFFPTALIYPDRAGETLSVTYNPSHKFYSPSQQTSDEIILIKCYDSKKDDGLARLTPHTAFYDERYKGKEGVKPRESIEIRCLVFYDEE